MLSGHHSTVSDTLCYLTMVGMYLGDITVMWKLQCYLDIIALSMTPCVM